MLLGDSYSGEVYYIHKTLDTSIIKRRNAYMTRFTYTTLINSLNIIIIIITRWFKILMLDIILQEVILIYLGVLLSREYVSYSIGRGLFARRDLQDWFMDVPQSFHTDSNYGGWLQNWGN